jgi:hypothetical protein
VDVKRGVKTVLSIFGDIFTDSGQGMDFKGCLSVSMGYLSLRLGSDVVLNA